MSSYDSTNKLQILGGMYSVDDNSDFFGFIDCSDYTISLLVRDRKESTIEYNKLSFKLFMGFLENSDFKNNVLCKHILINIVRQCFWVDFDFCKHIRAKLKLLNIEGYKIDSAISSELTKFLVTLNESLPEFTFNCLMKLCETAKNKGIKYNKGV